MYGSFKTPFAESIFKQKYANGPNDTWANLCRRLVNDVCGDRSLTVKEKCMPLMSKEDQAQLTNYIERMLFVPAGRYLYYAGRPASYFNNCLAMLAEEDTREEWARLAHNATQALMTGAGIGVNYDILRPEGHVIARTGGTSSGPIPLMHIINEIGRNVMQGGSRRSALYASLNWQHDDIRKFMHVKDWSAEIKDLKAKDFNFPATLDMTNISISWDTAFMEQVKAGNTPSLWNESVLQMCKTGEPGHSYNFYHNEADKGRNACQPGFATVLTPTGISTFDNIEIGSTVWSGKQWTKVVNKTYTGSKPVYKFTTTAGSFIGTEDHKVIQNGRRVEAGQANAIDVSVGTGCGLRLDKQAVMDGLLIGDGTIHKASNNLIYLCIGAKDTDYFESEITDLLLADRRRAFKCGWEVETWLPHTCFAKVAERDIPDQYYYGSPEKVQSFLRGLFTANGSISGKRVVLKQTSYVLICKVQEMLSSLGISSYITTNKCKDTTFSNGTYTQKQSYDINIYADKLIFRDKIGFIQKYKEAKLNEICFQFELTRPKKATFDVISKEYVGDQDVYEITVAAEEHTYWTGGLLVSNCSELTTENDSDICNLGSVNFGAIESLEELKDVVRLAAKFLICGTIRAELPYDKVKQVREEHRRIGLGIMGIHEWLLKRSYTYDMNDELHSWLQVWKDESESAANEHCDRFFLNRPKKYRAIAPAGSIGILASTTTGIEPLFAVAYKRRYLDGGTKWKYQYVIDSTAQHLMDAYGIDPSTIETSASLAADPERRIRFQYEVQKYVDMAISSTINLPAWGSDLNNEDTAGKLASTLLKYCEGLRGITVYPDGSRGGQPLEVVEYDLAKKHHGIIYAEENTCSGGICGI